MDPVLYPNATFPDQETLDVAKTFLHKAAAQRNSSGTPFWLGVGFVKPHLPHVFPKKFGELVPSPSNIDLAPNPNFTQGCPTIEWLGKGPTHGVYRPASTESAQLLRHAYYAAAAFSDSLLGELLTELDAVGRRDDTAVVLTADHGWGLGTLVLPCTTNLTQSDAPG